MWEVQRELHLYHRVMYGFHYANFHHSVSFVVTPNFIQIGQKYRKYRQNCIYAHH